MPPKRNAPANTAAEPVTSKRTKNEDDCADLKKKIADLKKVEGVKVHAIDKSITLPIANLRVYDDYDCVLNQTEIATNNNKFYIIQLIVNTKKAPEYLVWTRWGRVGEGGQTALLGPFAQLDEAKKVFEKKFREKTANKWSDRNEFTSRKGKYTLVDVLDQEEAPPRQIVLSIDSHIAPSVLDADTQALILRIFNPSMFEFTMKQMNLDVKKMPLGNLSAKQIASALEVLTELDEAVKCHRTDDVNNLSSRFYTLMPHHFGRQRPPPIATAEDVRQKIDMLLVLSDVHLAQQLQNEAKSTQTQKPNPVDEKYNLLKCQLDLLDPAHPDRKLIDEFFANTACKPSRILTVWRVDRMGEAAHFEKHMHLRNRKLLWHGTSVAVVAAILATGLRIMPHSGGLVGRGIYFASQAAKSQQYGYRDVDGHRIMFLCEVALGKEHHVRDPQYDLRKPPDGFDSVVALGKTDIALSDCKEVCFDKHTVKVPCGKPSPLSKDTRFQYSEYLIYQESQCRLRYVIEYVDSA